MPPPRSNLGTTTLSGRWRSRDPMRDFDALPAPLRGWLAQAVLPWSPVSCRRIWARARAQGQDTAAILDRLAEAERRALARDGYRSSTSMSPSNPTRAKRRR